MASYTLKLAKRMEVAKGTTAFSFEKPAGFRFAPGQFIEVTLLGPPETDAEGASRAFSIASAPFETNLMVATRMRDTAFKRALRSLPVGAEVRIEGPFGAFTLHGDAALLQELTALQRENPNFRLIATMTQMETSREAWTGETGSITGAMLAKDVSDLAAPIYSLAGPPEMVRAMRTMLRGAGVRDGIRTEEFAGY